MKLQRIKINELKQFNHPLTIDALQPGLNLFCGPNESGKSTVVNAIRAAFFERHRSSTVSGLRPYGDSSAAPEVELTFEHNGAQWHLVKRFLNKARCDIQIDQQHFSGDEAETLLATWLGFELPATGASKERHWGIPGLLWSEQGSGQDIETPVEHAGDYLKTALGEALSGVTATGADDVINAVRQQRADLLTPGGKPTKAYKKTAEQLESLTHSVAALRNQVAQYRDKVDWLGALRHDHQQDEQHKPWAAHRAELARAQTLLTEIEQLDAQQAQDNTALKELTQTQTLVTDQLQALHQYTADLAKRQQAAEDANARLEDLTTALTDAKPKLDQARADYDLAADQVKLARQQEAQQRQRDTQRQLKQQWVNAEKALTQAQQTHQDQASKREELTKIQINPDDLAALRDVSARLTEAVIREQSIATRMDLNLQPGHTVSLGTETIASTGHHRILEPTRLTIAGVGSIDISPGGEDLGELSRTLSQLRDKETNLLDQLAVDSLAAAEARGQRQLSLMQELNGLEKLLRSYAPDGLQTLEQEHSRIQDELHKLDQLLANPDDTNDINGLTVAAAEAAQQAANERLKTQEAQQQHLTQQVALAKQQRDTTAAEYDLLAATDSQEERTQKETELNAQLLDNRARQQLLTQAIQQRQTRIDDAKPSLIKQDIQRLTASADQSQHQFQARKEQILKLEAELSALGAQGLEEQLAEQLTELSTTQRRHDELAHRAAALEHLLDLLEQKRHALTQKLQAPLQKHLNHYLSILFPEAELTVNDNLVPTQLVRNGATAVERGEFNELSFGAREQMGLISRLAYADLLKEAGKPTLIILDDALVHSDEQRLASMKRVLFDASQRHQILLFTCHPKNWDGIGVAARNMADMNT
ncbi:MAG: AAA family ATPase [Natronospirillum sp.]